MQSFATIFLFVFAVLQGHLPWQVTAAFPHLPPPADASPDLSCPQAADIAPCICTVDLATSEINIDCSAISDEEELRKVFQADFPFIDLDELVIKGDKYRIGIFNFDENIFGSKSFKKITVFNTYLETIDSLTFANSFPVVKAMNFGNNRLHFFPFEILKDSVHLDTLILSNNLFEHMSDLNSNSLLKLDVSNNPGLRYEDQAFQTAPNLQVIDLSNTSLGHVTPLTFSYQTQLNDLDLSSNSIDYLYKDALKFLSTINVRINLDNNRIATVEPQAIYGNSDIQYICCVDIMCTCIHV